MYLWHLHEKLHFHIDLPLGKRRKLSFRYFTSILQLHEDLISWTFFSLWFPVNKSHMGWCWGLWWPHTITINSFRTFPCKASVDMLAVWAAAETWWRNMCMTSSSVGHCKHCWISFPHTLQNYVLTEYLSKYSFLHSHGPYNNFRFCSGTPSYLIHHMVLHWLEKNCEWNDVNT